VIRVFTSKVLDEALTPAERTALIQDFKQYKTGVLPALFGKDVPYDHLRKVHLQQVKSRQ
jgi:mRNA interferase YafO